MLAELTSKNQLTLPKAIISAFPDVDYFDVTGEGGRIVLTPVRLRPMSPKQWPGRAGLHETLRLVLDTNVLVSALLSAAGSLSWLRVSWRSKAIIPLASRDTTNELLRVISYSKFDLTSDDIDHLLADYLPWCEPVTVSETPRVPECRNPFDRPFLELALCGEADALVTGDRDLLARAPEFAVPIVTPRQIRTRLADPDAPKQHLV